MKFIKFFFGKAFCMSDKNHDHHYRRHKDRRDRERASRDYDRPKTESYPNDRPFSRRNYDHRQHDNSNNPIHTVFLFNIDFQTTVDQLKEFASEFGEIQLFYQPPKKKGMVFITFYDIRNAIRMVDEGFGRVINGNAIKTAYAYQPPKYSKRDPRDICSSTFFDSTSSDSNLTVDDIKLAAAEFGEVKMVEFKEDSKKFDVVYYDLRAAKAACEKKEISIKNELVKIEYNLDEGIGEAPVLNETSLAKKEKRSDRESRSGSRSDSRSRDRSDRNDRNDRSEKRRSDSKRNRSPEPQNSSSQYPYPYPYPYPYQYPYGMQYPGFTDFSTLAAAAAAINPAMTPGITPGMPPPPPAAPAQLPAIIPQPTALMPPAMPPMSPAATNPALAHAAPPPNYSTPPVNPAVNASPTPTPTYSYNYMNSYPPTATATPQTGSYPPQMNQYNPPPAQNPAPSVPNSVPTQNNPAPVQNTVQNTQSAPPAQFQGLNFAQHPFFAQESKVDSTMPGKSSTSSSNTENSALKQMVELFS
ncbi:hypothetical protein TRFO_01117 [Tritrichomonas foetus]|uniref:RRM domain-containing protein n=1 Tax=Tritrichomonas foetus TaxID=1144522 RepID=A0A1J4KNB4_9EUKA|nr:hypothetical protein TRFO_01117 [Tritrichomonas foetus]|eukprot:OHT11190.1 hypothetical protein TRFO_01117 [Tritrichomonas foetus]